MVSTILREIQRGVLISLKGLWPLELSCFLLAKIMASKRRKTYAKYSRLSGSPLYVFLREALDILLLKLKKEKKTPKIVCFFPPFLLLFSGAAPPGGNISILGATCSHPPEGDWSPLLLCLAGMLVRF